MRLKVGMIVCMSKQGRDTWEDGDDNPHKGVGVVDKVYEDELEYAEAEWEAGNVDEDNYFPYRVLWKSRKENSYRWGDLEEIREVVARPLEDYT